MNQEDKKKLAQLTKREEKLRKELDKVVSERCDLEPDEPERDGETLMELLRTIKWTTHYSLVDDALSVALSVATPLSDTQQDSLGDYHNEFYSWDDITLEVGMDSVVRIYPDSDAPITTSLKDAGLELVENLSEKYSACIDVLKKCISDYYLGFDFDEFLELHDQFGGNNKPAESTSEESR